MKSKRLRRRSCGCASLHNNGEQFRVPVAGIPDRSHEEGGGFGEIGQRILKALSMHGWMPDQAVFLILFFFLPFHIPHTIMLQSDLVGWFHPMHRWPKRTNQTSWISLSLTWRSRDEVHHQERRRTAQEAPYTPTDGHLNTTQTIASWYRDKEPKLRGTHLNWKLRSRVIINHRNGQDTIIHLHKRADD